MQCVSDAAITLDRTIGDVKFQATCIPPDIRGGWSLAQLADKDPVKRKAFETRLGSALARYTGSRVYAPAVAFHSGVIINDAAALTRGIPLSNGVTVFRNMELPADGVFLYRGDAFIMSAAGCWLVVATAGPHCITAHASRESLLDRVYVETGKFSRQRDLIGNITAAMQSRGVSPNKIRLRAYFGVAQKDLAHPFADAKHGEYNRNLPAFVKQHCGTGCVDVVGDEQNGIAYLGTAMVIERQASECGIEDVACERLLPTTGPFAHTRHEEERLQGERNLCILYRSQ